MFKNGWSRKKNENEEERIEMVEGKENKPLKNTNKSRE